MSVGVLVAVGLEVGDGVLDAVGEGVFVLVGDGDDVTVFVEVGVLVDVKVGVGVAVGAKVESCTTLADGLVEPDRVSPYSTRMRPSPPLPP